MSLDIRTESGEDLVLVTLAGELDIYTVDGFRTELEAIDPAGATVVIDLSEVTLLDSSGLGALVSMLRRSRQRGGVLGLICPHRRLRRVFEITGLRREFVFADDLPSLRAALAGAAGGE